MTDFSQRNPLPGVADLFWQRRSPRAFVKQPVAADAVARMIDAARWSPSCFNDQPWQFHTSTDASFGDFLSLLVEANQRWAQNAGLLGFVVARRHFGRDDSPNPYARFDAGAAWMALALQASLEGLHAHGMGGIEHDRVADYLNLDVERYEVVMGFAVGVAADPESLSAEQRAAEAATGRLDLDSIWIPH